VRFTDGDGYAEQRTSAASARTTTGATLQAAGLTALSTGSEPLRVAAAVPAGAVATEIAVFTAPAAVGPPSTLLAAKPRAQLVTRVMRSTPKAKRYTFRLTERKLKHLKPGRYTIEVRVGRDRAHLGPAVRRTLTIRAARR
ncbi:MAG: hypothetical protein JWO69_916, partial [Thermoleophilia bacterium]|nr:hypothetical protein [Thermoleophilia bacterium]